MLRVHRVPSPAGDAPLGAGGSAVKLAALVAGRAEALLVVAVRLVEACENVEFFKEDVLMSHKIKK